MILGVTGHQDIPPAATKHVTSAFKRRLAQATIPTGVCSLAAGADQLFAELLVQRGGELRVVIPCHGYSATFTAPQDLDKYRRLLADATDVVELDYPRPSEKAFFAAGRRVVDMSDELLAIWDGKPARGLGGTADVVAYAREQGKPVVIVWPKGVARL
jgi:hypothetical protein